MTEQKKCENCGFWRKEVKGGQGAVSPGGKFREPEEKGGICRKLNEVKSANDYCEGWEPRK